MAEIFSPNKLDGKRLPNRESFPATGQKLLTDWAVWDSYKLVQPTADGFTIQKRTNPQSCWLDAAWGRRASGLVFVGDVSGGLSVGLKNLWQSYPAALVVTRCSGDGSAALRYQVARSRFELRRCTTGFQHATWNRAYQRVDAVPQRRRPLSRGNREAGETAFAGRITAAYSLLEGFRNLEPVRTESALWLRSCNGEDDSSGSGRFGVYNLATIMGGAEVVFELNELIDHAGWRKAWKQYCLLTRATKEVAARDNTTGNEGANGEYAQFGRLAAYVYLESKNAALAKKAWSASSSIAKEHRTRRRPQISNVKTLPPRGVYERFSTRLGYP